MEEDITTEFPQISICIPVYNAEHFIGITLNCLLNQSYANIEIILVNDNSIDDTYNILADYEEKFPDKIKLYNSSKKGAAAARNLAYKNSSGEFIVFFDADDLIESEFIKKQYEVLLKSNGDCVISSWGRFYESKQSFKKDLFTIEKDMSFEEWIIYYWYNNRHTTTPGRVLASRDLIQKTSLWNEELSLNDDFQFFSDLFSKTEKIYFNSHETFMYRTGNTGLSTQTTTKEHQLSNLNSLLIGINTAQILYNNPKHQLAYANLLQGFIYQCYPKHHDLIEKAEVKIKLLRRANLSIPARKSIQILARIIGWKNWFKIKYFFKTRI